MRFGTGDGPQTERGRHHQGSRPGAKGVGQMRTLWEQLESEGEDFIDPLETEGGDLSNQPLNDPDS
jgi:hypothetical protein